MLKLLIKSNKLLCGLFNTSFFRLDFISQVKGHHAIEQMGEEGAMIQQMTLPQKQSPQQQQQTYDAGYDGDAKYEGGINGYNDNLNEGLDPVRLQRQD